jgi:glycosyltransferase involved in cell wall biosynthesis
MAFPVPSEAFASVEINELRRRKIDVFVKTIRNKRPDHEHVTVQQQVQGVSVEHADWASPFRGLIVAVKRPRLAIRLWWKLVASLASRPIVLLACLFWSLRCFELFDRLRREKPDVVHLYWGHVPSMLGWLVLETSVNQVITIGLSAYDLEMSIPLSSEVARRCKGVRSWAGVNGDEIQSRGIPADRIQLVFQGISVKQFDGGTTSQNYKAQHRLVFAGRLIPEKGVDLVLELARRLQIGFPDIEVVVIGTGSRCDALRQQVKQWQLEHCIHFRGHLSHSEFAAELTQANLFVLPSRHSAERLPNVIKEAAAAGCCCLTTATPGIDALICDQISGRILPADDVDAWVTAVTELLRNPDLARRMAEVAKRQVQEHFDIERTTDQLIGWWNQVLHASGHQRRAEL